jgi:hypothetical protein
MAAYIDREYENEDFEEVTATLPLGNLNVEYFQEWGKYSIVYDHGPDTTLPAIRVLIALHLQWLRELPTVENPQEYHRALMLLEGLIREGEAEYGYNEAKEAGEIE